MPVYNIPKLENWLLVLYIAAAVKLIETNSQPQRLTQIEAEIEAIGGDDAVRILNALKVPKLTAQGKQVKQDMINDFGVIKVPGILKPMSIGDLGAMISTIIALASNKGVLNNPELYKAVPVLAGKIANMANYQRREISFILNGAFID